MIDNRFEITPDDVVMLRKTFTPRDALDFQRQVGSTLQAAFSAISENQSEMDFSETQILAWSGIVWLIGRKKGVEDFSFDDALDIPFLDTYAQSEEEEAAEDENPTVPEEGNLQLSESPE